MPKGDSDDDTSKWTYNGSKAQWSNFNQEATVYTMSSDLMTAIKDGKAVKIDDQDDLERFNEYFKHGYAKASTESVAAGNRYKTIENYQALVRDAKNQALSMVIQTYQRRSKGCCCFQRKG
jgi:hypothetical protein